jgi:hypothetical protein
MPRRLLPLLLLLVCLPPGAEVYRWIDAEGNVHYADRRPEAGARGVQSLQLPEEASKSDPAVQAERERARRLLRVWDEERLARERATAEQAAALESLCARLRSHLEELERARLVYREDGSPAPQPLSEAERQSYEQSLRATWGDRCS